VFHPPIQCNDGVERKKGIGKVFFQQRHKYVEQAMAQRLKQIDRRSRFTNPLMHECTIDRQALFSHTDTGKKCKRALKNRSNHFEQLIYKHKGVDLRTYMRKVQHFKMVDQPTNKFILTLLKCVALLQKHDIVHLDVKPANILITDDDRLLMIDFGLARHPSLVYDVNSSKHLLSHKYYVYPPEFKIYTSLQALSSSKRLSNSYVTNDYDTFLSDWKAAVLKANTRWYTNYGRLRAWLKEVPITFEELTTDLEQFVDQLFDNFKTQRLSNESLDRIYDIFNVIANKVDIFGVGVSVLIMFCTSQDKATMEASVKKRFVRLITRCIQMNPYKRYDVNQALRYYKTIVRYIKEH
jgi:serine/threonine protein kinase